MNKNEEKYETTGTMNKHEREKEIDVGILKDQTEVK
jgi:hypothetical protein